MALLCCLFGNVQSKNEVTILYLLPFHLNESVNYTSLRSGADINQVMQFEMMGFWLGAKMALQEYEYTDKRINVIVRDAVRDITALNKILEDTDLMENVNIIIGPFYGSLFPVAADFAKEHNIIIVNPFSVRFDFVENNPLVYKLTPPFASRPETIAKVFLSQPNEYNIILWVDSNPTPDLRAYRSYFKEYKIHFKEMESLTLPQNTTKKNLIIALFDEPERVIHSIHTLTNNDPEDNVQNILVVPAKWLSIPELKEDFFTLPQLYYFTNYFVDEKSSIVKQFQSDYIFNYEAPAELAAYSYQGYDITRYFIDLHFVDSNTDNAHFQPFSYKFQWRRVPNGGYENVKARFIQVKNLELEEVD